MNQQHTRKKIKFVGTETFINPYTGECVDMQVTSIEERDFNFHKVWLKNLISTLDLVGNKKTKVAYWIVENLTTKNELICTFREIAKELDISVKSVNETMRILQEGDFLRKVRNGYYIVNPDIIYKGQKTNRLNVLHTYSDIQKDKTETSDIEKLNNLLKTIDDLKDQADKLKLKIKNENKNNLKVVGKDV